MPVLPLVCLGIGLICALVSRILLLIAAARISFWWMAGVLVPFGPLFFRLSYPEEAQTSRMFRLATLPCLFLYLMLGPGLLTGAHGRSRLSQPEPDSAKLVHYGLEKSPAIAKKASLGAGPVVQLMPGFQERLTENTREFERLQVWKEKLRLVKRDLLHSDTEGNRAYDLELAQYNDALAQADAERIQLSPLPK
jgi:hypothetical protein